jgi:tellurite resistance protein
VLDVETGRGGGFFSSLQSILWAVKTLPLFGSVLGLGGLCNAWRAAHVAWGVPLWGAHFLAVLASLSVLACWLLLARELSRFGSDWARQLLLVVREPLAALFSMTALVESLVLQPFTPTFALALFSVALCAQFLVGVECGAALWRAQRSAGTITPTLLMPTVGGFFLGSLCASRFGFAELATVTFGAGLFSWLVTESVVIWRLMNEPLPVAARSTLGIHVTPAAIGCLACLSMSGPAGAIAPLLFGYALLQAAVVLRVGAWLREQPFSGSAWAYTFGISALSSSAIGFAQRSPSGALAACAWPLFLAANLVIGFIALRTMSAASRLLPLRWRKSLPQLRSW